MKQYILDASFLLAILLEESPAAKKVFRKISGEQKLGKAKLFAPNLVFWEVANGLRYRVVSPQESAALYRKLDELPMEFLLLDSEQMLFAINLAYDLEATVYDTSYHVLAKSLDGTFLTCDQKYFQKAKKLGEIELI